MSSRRRRAALVIAAISSTLGLGTSASAAAAEPVQLYRQNGLDAQATFVTTNGSIRTEFFVNADTQDLATAPGQSTSFSQAVGSLGQVDTETGAGFILFCIPMGSSPIAPILPTGAFSVDPNLGGARLQATFTCSGVPIDVDLTWTTEGVSRGTGGGFTLHTPELFLNVAFQGVIARDAIASGTVSDGSTSFAPNPSESAAVFRFGTEQIVIS